jgi:Cytochrome P460
MKRLHATVIGSCVFMICTGFLTLARSAGTPDVVRARFNADGSVNIPTGYRQWLHIGTRYKPLGINILDFQQTKTPEIFNAYVEPSAFAAFQATGIWPDGAQLVKEFTAVRVGDGCDEKTMLCDSPLGTGIVETGYIGLGMMVKDAQRFPEGKANWGYFSFGHKPPPYEKTSMVHPPQQCESCHVKLASDTDYVITRAHVGLDNLRK